MTGRQRAGLALAAGLTLALGAPPIRFWPSTFVAMALFAASIEDASIPRAAFSGWIMGTAATLGAFYWIVGTVSRFTALGMPLSILAYVLMSCLAGLTLSAAAALSRTIVDIVGHPIALALGIVVAERFAPSVFPWQIAAPLIFAPWISQCADLVGVSGLGALLVASMAVIVRALAHRLKLREEPVRESHFVLALLIMVCAWGYGAGRTDRVARAMADAPNVRVALIQPSIAPVVRWEDEFHSEIVRNLHLQTHAAMSLNPQLVVWPEGSYPYMLPHRAGFDGELADVVYPWQSDVPIVVGAVERDDAGNVYNSAIIRDVDGSLSAPADKRVLVPFGEYVPVVGQIPWFRRVFSRASGITPGTQPTILTTQSHLKLGILNCFEDTIPWVSAELSRTDFLINITNDAWFGDGAAPWQHLMLAQWRAIETRRELLRAVNTGVTCHVDALGEIRTYLPLTQPATLVIDAHRMTLRALAPMFIRWTPWLTLIAFVLAGIAQFWRRIRTRRS